METKICQQCNKKFVIDQKDQDFYAQIKVPTPTFCPTCRLIRRLSFLNWISLYRRTCDNCNKNIISIHHQDKPYRVFCNECWWSDSWDGTEYSIDYDPTKNFFEQILDLRNKSIFMALENNHTTLINSEYVNATGYMKDCFMSFNADYGEKTAYSVVFAHANECLDTYRVKKSELCYECTGIHKSYGCIYSEELDSCTNVLFSRSCFGCTDCFGCINLRNKSYHIFNIPYTKEEYFQKINELQLNTRSGIKNAHVASRSFWMKYPRRATIGNGLNVNTTGDFIYESKNTHDSFMITSAEDSRYVSMLTLGPTKNCYDYTNWGAGAENLYECLTVGEGAYNTKFSVQCWPQSMNNEYCLYTNSSADCFGCVNLKKKKYCILNKQYTKEEYETLKQKIITEMKEGNYLDTTGHIYKYGELFPYEFSPFAYNETMANYFFPKTKEEIIEQGYVWFDQDTKQHEVSMESGEIPENIEDIEDSILEEILRCTTCSNGFNISEIELYLHKKIKVPLPDMCWKCRFRRRFDSVNQPFLYERNCMKCNSNIVTSYDINRLEIVYCEKCYQQEII